MATYSIKCVAVTPTADGSQVSIQVEQRYAAADAEPIRTFPVLVPLGATTAAIVAAAKADVAAWHAAKVAAAAKATADAAEVTRLGSLVGQATTVTV